jgi:hypothetical protein
MIQIENKLAKKLQEIWDSAAYDRTFFVAFFDFIKGYKEFYKAFLKSNSPSFVLSHMLKKQKEQLRQVAGRKNFNYTEAEIEYHLYFFGGGLKAICGQWITNDCKETPEQMAKIIYDEYSNNAKYF